MSARLEISSQLAHRRSHVLQGSDKKNLVELSINRLKVCLNNLHLN